MSLEQPFAEALDANKERIYRICSIYAVSPFEPQDLFQEVVFQIWKSFPSFRNEANIGTWIYRISVNVCYNFKLKFDRKNVRTDRLESIRYTHLEISSDSKQQDKFQTLKECISHLLSLIHI